MNLKISLFLGTAALLSQFNLVPVQSSQSKNVPITGTWELVSGITIQKGDTTFTDYRKNQKQIKIINDTHFAFLNHDLKTITGEKPVFVAGGGKYTLKGDEYTEHLEYCNFREWENKTFKFRVSVKGDTLIQRGIERIEELGVDREIIEKYVKAKP